MKMSIFNNVRKRSIKFIYYSIRLQLITDLYVSPYVFTQLSIVDIESDFRRFFASFGGGSPLLGSVSSISTNSSWRESTTMFRKLCDRSKISIITWNADKRISLWSSDSCFIKASYKGRITVSSALKRERLRNSITRMQNFLKVKVQRVRMYLMSLRSYLHPRLMNFMCLGSTWFFPVMVIVSIAFAIFACCILPFHWNSAFLVSLLSVWRDSITLLATRLFIQFFAT